MTLVPGLGDPDSNKRESVTQAPSLKCYLDNRSNRCAFPRDWRVSPMLSRTSLSRSRIFPAHTRVSPIDSHAFEPDTRAFQ
jgi:hypothetical protein